jgi:hypothetical protein
MRPLELSASEFRALGHQVVDVAAEFLATLDGRRTFPATSAEETSRAFDLPLTEEGLGEAVFDELRAMTTYSRASTGRLFPYVVGSGEPIERLAISTHRCSIRT